MTELQLLHQINNRLALLITKGEEIRGEIEVCKMSLVIIGLAICILLIGILIGV